MKIMLAVGISVCLLAAVASVYGLFVPCPLKEKVYAGVTFLVSVGFAAMLGEILYNEL